MIENQSLTTTPCRHLSVNVVEDRDTAYTAMGIIGRPKHVVEIGVYMPGHMQLLPFVFDKDCRVQMFEPQETCADMLRTFFMGKENAEVHQVAVDDHFGQVDLCIPKSTKKCPDAASSAFVEGIYSPYSAREEAGRPEDMDMARVEIVPLSDFDDGTIDVLAIDTEGNEWPAIKTMISRPRVIGLEMRGKFGYENPYTSEIEGWMLDNGYSLHNRGKTDNIYVRSDND